MPQGSRGYIGYKKEVTWGTDIGGAATRFFPFTNETLTPKVEDLLSAIQRGILDEPKSYQGEKSFGGDLLVEVHPVSIGHILRSTLGAPAGEVLASSTETEFCNCETAWEHDDYVITSLDPSDKKKGTYSSKIQVSKGAGVGVLASRVISFNFADPATTSYKFWIKSSIALSANDLGFVVSEQELGGEGAHFDLVNIPEIAVPNQWYEFTIAIGVVSDMETAISCAIKMLVNKDEFELRVDDFRAVVAGSADKAYKHVFTPMQTKAQEFAAGAQNSPLWPYTFDIFRDEGLPFALLGAVVNTMALSFSTTDKILKAACGIVAKNQAVGTAAGLSLEATKPFVWENAKIGVGGTVVAARNNDLESFSLTWDNKCIAKYFLNNTAIPGKIIRDGIREIPVSFVIDFVDRTEYNHFLNGQERQFQILLEGAKVPDDAANTPYTLQLDLPLVRYLAYPLNIGGPGRLTCAVTGKAKYSGGHVLQASLINAERTAEYAA
jgi:hypothetical protein